MVAVFELKAPYKSELPRLDVKFPILGFLMDSPMSGYDLKRCFRDSVGFFYRASDGSLYPALKTLAERGFVKMKVERTGGRSRKLYAITARGREWFLRTLAEPSPPIFVHDEASVKLYFAHHQPEVGITHIQWMREQCAQLAAFLGRIEDEMPENAASHYRRVVLEMGKRITAFRVDMLAEIAARARSALSSTGGRIVGSKKLAEQH